MEFDASLADLIVYHEQFVGKDNQQLRLLSAELNRDNLNEEQDQKLVSVTFLHTSPKNPLFSSSIYNGIENKAHVHLTKLVVTLQLEALLSILRFQDALSRKLPKDILEDDTKKKQQLTIPEENKNFGRSISTSGKVVKKIGKQAMFRILCIEIYLDVPVTPTLKIKADLEEFRVIIASKVTQLFDIQVQGVKGDVSQAPEKTLINLILTDLRVFDPYEGARYRKVRTHEKRK
jgi:hypothetical protein